MKNYPLWKSFLVIIVVLIGFIFSIPTMIYSENENNWFLNHKINLGLDLQGGSYLLLEVKSDILFKEEFENISDFVRIISRNEQINILDIQHDYANDSIEFKFKNDSYLDSIKKEFFKNYRDVDAIIKNNSLKINLKEGYIKNIQESAIKQSLEIVRKRIDESGTKEPLIQRLKQDILLEVIFNSLMNLDSQL